MNAAVSFAVFRAKRIMPSTQEDDKTAHADFLDTSQNKES